MLSMTDQTLKIEFCQCGDKTQRSQYAFSGGVVFVTELQIHDLLSELKFVQSLVGL